MGEHAFPLTGFVCRSAHVTFGGSGGIRSTAREELPYPCNSQAKSRDKTSRRGELCDSVESDIIDMQITNSVVCGRSKGCIYKQIKPPLVGEHAFPLTGFVCKSAHITSLNLIGCRR